MLGYFHQLQDTARGYRLTQVLGLPTILRYRRLVEKYVPHDLDRSILEIGCGLGSARTLFGGAYTGIDINAAYIDKASQKYTGQFLVMDAGNMTFAPNTFDDAVSIATSHHLSDDKLAMMIRTSLIVAPCLHLIDAILPLASGSPFKTILFRMDRGQYVRKCQQLKDIVAANARIDGHQILEGPLHDVMYIRAIRK